MFWKLLECSGNISKKEESMEQALAGVVPGGIDDI
jgi:hypothetical protein